MAFTVSGVPAKDVSVALARTAVFVSTGDFYATTLVAKLGYTPEDEERTRADSIHLLCVNPATGQGTLLGFPRDSWVEIPGHGRGKINNALALAILLA